MTQTLALHKKTQTQWLLCAAVFLVTFSTFLAQAQLRAEATEHIYNQPTELISAPPVSSFSERASLWPSYETPQDVLKGDQTSLTDQFNSIPGMAARFSGSPTISIRGSVQADRVLKLYDGIPLNLADGLGGSDLFIPEEAIGMIRILKGPASVFYGASAMRGAVDYRTRIFDRPAVQLSLDDDTGELGGRRVFAVAPFQVGRSDSGKPNFQATGFYDRTPGHFHYDSPNGLGSGRLSQNWSETSRASVSGATKVGGFQLSPRLVLTHSVGEGPGPLNSPFPNSFEDTAVLGSLEASKTISDALSVSLRLSELQFSGRFDKGSPEQSDSTSGRTQISNDIEYRWFQTVLSKTFFDLTFDSFSASYAGDSKFHSGQFEVGQSYEIPIQNDFYLIPAFRYLEARGQFLKSLMLLHEVQATRTWLLYSEGYRTPSLSDRYTNVSYFKGNPQLKPEKSSSLEAGFSFESPHGATVDGLTFGGAVYSINDHDLIDTAPAGLAATTKVNTGEARTWGAELKAGYTYHVWNFSLSYNHLDAKNQTTTEPLRLAPTQQVTAAISQQLGPVVMELEDTYWSTYWDREFPSNELRSLPSWNKVDLNFRTLGLSDWEIKAGILNVGDTPRQLTWGYPEPQRRFYASALRYF
jgi:vitamin B12 transporter